MKLKPISIRLKSWQWAVAALLLTVVVIVLSYMLSEAVDFHNCFRPSVIGALHGRSPFEIACYFNVPWAVLPLIPIAILPEQIGRAVLFVCALIAYIFAAQRFGAKPLSLVFFLLSPPVIHDLINGNLDWMVVLGFVLPHPIGIFFLAIKPQLSAALALFWLIEDWRAGGWRLVLRNYMPVAIAFLLTLAIYGIWPLRFGIGLEASWEANASLWPMSIPVGLALMIAAIRQRNQRFATAASPCFSPYLKFHSWNVAFWLLSTASRKRLPQLWACGFWWRFAPRAGKFSWFFQIGHPPQVCLRGS
mgnify:CR=1 FL=1